MALLCAVMLIAGLSAIGVAIFASPAAKDALQSVSGRVTSVQRGPTHVPFEQWKDKEDTNGTFLLLDTFPTAIRIPPPIKQDAVFAAVKAGDTVAVRYYRSRLAENHMAVMEIATANGGCLPCYADTRHQRNLERLWWLLGGAGGLFCALLCGRLSRQVSNDQVEV